MSEVCCGGCLPSSNLPREFYCLPGIILAWPGVLIALRESMYGRIAPMNALITVVIGSGMCMYVRNI